MLALGFVRRPEPRRPGVGQLQPPRARRARRPTRPARLTNLSGERRVLWEVALDTFGDHPIAGIGRRDVRVRVESFAALDAHGARRALALSRGARGDRASRARLLIVVALGALLVAAFISPFRQLSPRRGRGQRPAARAPSSRSSIAAGVDWMWESTAVTLLAFACGMLGAASQSRDVGRPRRATRVGITVLSLGAFWRCSFPPWWPPSSSTTAEQAARDTTPVRGGRKRHDGDQPAAVVRPCVPAAGARAREVRPARRRRQGRAQGRGSRDRPTTRTG